MCDRRTSLSDPTADLILSDLLSTTEDLIDFSINLFDTIRLQTHFNDRNRRISLSSQLKDVLNAQKTDVGFVDIPTKPCTVTSTLKYDLSLYINRILQACKRTKANLMLLRVSRVRSPNTPLLLFASTNVRLEQLNKKVQLLTRLIKDNGGEFPGKKKKKKTDESSAKKKSTLKLMSKEDLNDYVEICLSFRTIIEKYREFIVQIRDTSKSIANTILLIPIASNAINELNDILNRLIRIAYTSEAEANFLRKLPNEKHESDRISSKTDSNIQIYNQDFLRNQSAFISTNSLEFSSNIIANIFQDFFSDYQ